MWENTKYIESMGWRLQLFKHQVSLPVDKIGVTNECLDLKYVEKLVDQLISGEIKPTDLDPIHVNIILGEGYFARNGNHRLAAFKRAGIRSIRAELEKFSRRPPESL